MAKGKKALIAIAIVVACLGVLSGIVFFLGSGMEYQSVCDKHFEDVLKSRGLHYPGKWLNHEEYLSGTKCSVPQLERWADRRR